MSNTDDTFETYKRCEKAQAEANRINKDEIFDVLSVAGITSVSAQFDGEGDSGQLNEITAFKDTVMVALPDLPLLLLRASWTTGKLDSQQTTLRDGIETLCYDYLSQQHGGWEDNDGAFGEFVFDVAERSLELEFNARFSASTLFTHSF